MDKIDANAHYNPPVADPLDPITFVHNIKVPTFMACQWEDEQTGGHCRDLVQHFTGSKRKWFTFTNGAHVDSLDPYTFDRWYDFLELFVAHQAPIINRAVIRAAAPEIYQSAMGLPQDDAATLPVDPIQLEPTYQSALWRSTRSPMFGCCSTTAAAPRRRAARRPATPTRGSSARSRRSRCPARPCAGGTWGQAEP